MISMLPVVCSLIDVAKYRTKNVTHNWVDLLLKGFPGEWFQLMIPFSSISEEPHTCKLQR